MNKKQAIAYAQIALNYMQSSKYNGEITPETLGLEMKQCFKLYTRDIVTSIADAQIKTARELRNMKTGCDENG